MSDDLMRVLIRVKIEKAREAMGEAIWCFEGEKFPAAVNRLYYAMYRACLALLVGEDRIPAKHTAVIGPLLSLVLLCGQAAHNNRCRQQEALARYNSRGSSPGLGLS